MLHLDLPFRFDERGRTATTDLDGHIRNLMEQFLFTEAGERVNRPDFGSGLSQLVFGPNTPEVAAALQHTVHAGLQRWLSHLVEVRELEVESRDSTLRIELVYTVRRTGETRSATLEREVGS
jgi:uncharacterized protein